LGLEIWELAVLAAAGVAAGTINVLAGGGSLLTVPVMIFMGIPGPVANGTNRIAVVAQGLVATVTFFRRGYRNLRLSLTLAACTIPGAIVGAYLGTEFSGVWFNRLLALIMLGVMLLSLFSPAPKLKPEVGPTGRQLVIGHILMAGIGFWGGFIQIGVGLLMMPVMNRVMGLDLVTTNMHKTVIATVFTSVALIVFVSRIELLWVVGAALALGNAIGGYLGTRLAIAKGERLIRIVLNTVLVIFIVKLLFVD
jgi:uncharacterized protein